MPYPTCDIRWRPGKSPFSASGVAAAVGRAAAAVPGKAVVMVVTLSAVMGVAMEMSAT
jgi:hypothetical protein